MPLPVSLVRCAEPGCRLPPGDAVAGDAVAGDAVAGDAVRATAAAAAPVSRFRRGMFMVRLRCLGRIDVDSLASRIWTRRTTVRLSTTPGPGPGGEGTIELPLGVKHWAAQGRTYSPALLWKRLASPGGRAGDFTAWSCSFRTARPGRPRWEGPDGDCAARSPPGEMTPPSAGGVGGGRGEGEGTGAGMVEWQPGSLGTTADRPGSRVTDSTPGVVTGLAACRPVSRAVKRPGSILPVSLSRTV